MNNKKAGDSGEKLVCELVPCPNCGTKLILLPENNPLYDVQCSRCTFRAQVKTIQSKPTSKIRGAGWEIIEKVHKSGFLLPPLIAFFVWDENQEVRFYPFIPKKNLKHRKLSPVAQRANYKMFNYVGLDKLPYFVL
jgi:DNA-directed RNA polymerase subunit RPC12/RpoP